MTNQHSNKSSENITISIQNDDLTVFFRHYDRLGDVQKNIWNRIVWYCKRYPNAHPTQRKIAFSIGCSVKHVNKSFKKFMELGWLVLFSRGPRRAKELMIPDHLFMIDVVNRKWFRKVEVISGVIHSKPLENPTSSGLTSNKNLHEPPPLNRHGFLDSMGFTDEQILKLGALPSNVVREAFQRFKKSKSNVLTTNHKFLVGIAFHIARERGDEVNWRGFYKAQAELKNRRKNANN